MPPYIVAITDHTVKSPAASWLHLNPDQSLSPKPKPVVPPVSVQSVQPLNEPPGPLCFLPSSAPTLSWSCPCSSLHPLSFVCHIFLQHLKLEPSFCWGTSKRWVNPNLTYTSCRPETLYLLLFLFWHLFLSLKLHLDNYSGTDLL